MDKLYFKTDNKYKTVASLILDLYAESDGRDSEICVRKTYYDPQCREFQCSIAYRSFGDLLAICNGYFKDVTETQLIKALISIKEDTKNDIYPSFYYCHDIDKIVLQMSDWINAEFTSDCDEDELDCDNVYSLSKIDDIYTKLMRASRQAKTIKK